MTFFHLIGNIFAICVLLGVSQSTYADNYVREIVIDRSEVKVGDLWVFNYLDGYNRAVISADTEKVTAVSGTEITTDSSRDGKLVYNFDWNLIAQLDGDKRTGLKTFRPSLAFPLSIGKSWKSLRDYTNARGQQLNYKPEAEVIVWEKVTVPAGIFDAIRIKSSGSFSGSGSSGAFNGSFFETYWYSPEARRVVKYEFQNSAGTRFATELVSYRLTPR